MSCEHKWVYKGVVFDNDDYPMPGTGAKRRHYYDEYFCEKCLQKKHTRLPTDCNTYNKVQFNAVPKSPSAKPDEEK